MTQSTSKLQRATLTKAKRTKRSIGDSLFDARNRLFANKKFQQWAAACPFTAPITRQRAGRLFDICAGFTYTQILTACVDLEVFDRLTDGAIPISKLALDIGLSRDATDRLVAGAIALQLLQRRPQDHIGLGAQGAALLGNKSVFAMIQHHKLLYDDLRDPVQLLRNDRGETNLKKYWAYANNELAEDAPVQNTNQYSELMAATQEFIADDVLSAYSLERHRQLLDVGGGVGVFAAAAIERASALCATVFDLPSVADKANEGFRNTGIDDRITAIGGNFFKDSFPKGEGVGPDIISFVRVLHDHDDDAVKLLLQKAYGVLGPKGTLLIAEPMAETPGARAMGEAYFGFYLWAMGSGRPRSAETLLDYVKDTGFRKARLLRTRQPLLTRAIVAVK